MMTEPVSQPEKHDTLSVIREGMPVVDSGGKRVGKVTELFLGAEADTLEKPGVVPETARGTAPTDGDSFMAPAFVVPFDPDNQLPEAVRRRLQYNGFVRIDAGALHRDRYALREQVAGVTGDEVRLNVVEDELIKA